MRKIVALASLCLIMNNAYANALPEEALQKTVISSMQKYKVPVVSLAIIDHNKIIYTHAYSIENDLSVTNKSLFQSASIGKSVSAYGSLLLVDKERITLDADVNNYLRSWKVPANQYTTVNKVTLRNILDMTSGLSVSGFVGSSPDDPIPTLKQILNGEYPAENEPVRVQFSPGSKYFYSGGSYQVLQQLIEDVTHASFSDFIKAKVLVPLNMQDSQFIAILPKSSSAEAVPGFLKNGNMIPGKWKIISALAAGGMWTTPTDLAKFSLNIIKSYRGQPGGLLSKHLASEMLTRQQNTDFGLGFVIDGYGKNLNFRKEGHNIGFYNWLIVFPNAGQGIVVMTDSENGVPVIKSIVAEVANLYNWPSYYPLVDESQQISSAV